MPEASFFFAANSLSAILFAFVVPSKSINPIFVAATFNFVSGGDVLAQSASITSLVNQIPAPDPDRVTSIEKNPMITDIRNAGMFDSNFLVWGNYDERSVSAILRENYLTISPNIVVFQSNVADYVLLNSSIDCLN
jgi:hypothetical protein